eukprot:TRINITY_DN25280_c0_g1_i1.p1 TRINITY_DN25280_c0_g1~~TRINITY_DN25280_c0_g1_i1.p1  ORF type:complete len:121 (+),score=12.58 TRINITY_DN25280_c0_g1_i1:128-490(+)
MKPVMQQVLMVTKQITRHLILAQYMFFSRDSINNWAQQAYIKTSNTESEKVWDYFLEEGKSSLIFSADGNMLAVGAYFDYDDSKGISDGPTNNNAAGSGAMYIFSRNNGTTWSKKSLSKI